MSAEGDAMFYAECAQRLDQVWLDIQRAIVFGTHEEADGPKWAQALREGRLDRERMERRRLGRMYLTGSVVCAEITRPQPPVHPSERSGGIPIGWASR